MRAGCLQLRATTDKLYEIIKGTGPGASGDSHKQNTTEVDFVFAEKFTFPLDTVAVVLNFNNQIANDSDYRKYLVSYLRFK